MSAQDMFDLTGRIAVVTGASRGIGQAIAVAFAERGAHVLAVARGSEGLHETVKSAEGSQGTVVAYVADLADLDAPNSIIVRAVDVFGGLDVFVNNAGAFHAAPIEDTRAVGCDPRRGDAFGRLAVSCREPASGSFRGRQGHQDVFCGRPDRAIGQHGLRGRRPGSSLGPSCSQPNGEREMCRSNAIAPGFVETEMMAHVLENERTAKWIRRTVLLQRWATVEDIAGPAVFLASSASDFMTGQTMLADGGQFTV